MVERYNKVLLKVWSKNTKDIQATQNIFNHRAKMCSLAALGKWSKNLKINKKNLFILFLQIKLLLIFIKI